MERKVLVVCLVVGFLGVVSAALAFAGEGTKVTLNDVQTTESGQCMYPRSPALTLGLMSALCLLLAQAIINTVAGCICCKPRPHTSGSRWTVGLICFIISWVTFVLGFLLLLAAAALNDQRYDQNINYGYYCFVVKPGVFTGAGILALASVALGLVYYLTIDSMKSSQSWGPQPNQQGGIAMGAPQVPPQTTEPVFVHEDTYNRRQIP